MICCAAFAWIGATAAPASGFNYVLDAKFGAPGNGDVQFTQPQGLAVDQLTHDVYVADEGNHRIEKLDTAGHLLAVWGWGVSDGEPHSEVCTANCRAGLEGNGAGQLSRPVAVAVDDSTDSAQGDVYVADQGNNSIDVFSSSGEYLRTIEITGGYKGVLEVAVDSTGNVWVYDSEANVYEFSEGGSTLRTWNTGFGTSAGFAVNAEDDVFAVAGCLCTEKFTGRGEALGELDPENEHATGLAVDREADLLFSDQGTFVAKYNAAATPPTKPLATLGTGVLQGGTGVAVDGTTGSVYVADAARDEIDVFAPPSGPPSIEVLYVTEVTATSAYLNATIYPSQHPTTYKFEYGTTPSYGSAAPLPAAAAGSGIDEINVLQHLTGLTPNTVYHYRVVASSAAGTADSADQVFTTAPLGPVTLPDGRVYELVSPVEKNSGDIARGNVHVASSGDAIAYESPASFAGSPSALLSNEYLSTRAPNSWVTRGISPPGNETTRIEFEGPYRSFTADLSTGILQWEKPTLTPTAPWGSDNLYLRNLASGEYQLITNVTPPHEAAPSIQYVGGSATDSRVIFEEGDSLTPNAVPSASNVYEWAAGTISLVSVPPGTDTGVVASAGNGSGDINGAVSSDGSRVFWSDTTAEKALYLREDGTTTVQVNTSQRDPSLGNGSAEFLGATPTGSAVLFTDSTALTNDREDGGGLYEYSTATHELRDLTQDASGNPEVQGVAGYSDDGAYVYVVAHSVLSAAENSEGASATTGAENLYLVHPDGAGEQIAFVATLASRDETDWSSSPGRTASLTPDGTHLLFESHVQLTAYKTNGVDEIYLYDADTGQLHCVSCNPSGEPPLHGATILGSSNTNNPHDLTDNGARVFFDSNDALAPRATNGDEGVYEWERTGFGSCGEAAGCVYLIADGADGGTTSFAGADPTGENVFFTSPAQLIHEDSDESVKLYDARIDGGFPAVATTSCTGEACQGPPAAPLALAAPLTALIAPVVEAAPAREAHQGTARTASFRVGPVGIRAATRFARTGRLMLAVAVSEAGRVAATATANIARRSRAVASAAASAKRAQIVTVPLALSPAARKVLQQRHRLTLEITVRYSQVTRVARETVTLRG